MTALPERITFLGFGLIGGSIARSLRSAGSTAQLRAWTPTGNGPEEGVRQGIIHEAAPTPAAALDGAELVVLAGPPLGILDAIGSLRGAWHADLATDATVTDVGSTKARIVAAAETAGLRFVGGHPMAGRETTGFASATPDLFTDRPWVVVPSSTAQTLDIERVEALARAAGARPTRLGADEHDEAVAAVSHLPLVLAASLVEAVALAPDASRAWPTARSLAAGGWRDMTRLAMGDPEMGAGILATNAGPVAEHLRAVRRALDRWIEHLDEGAPAAATRERLAAARDALAERA